MILADAHVHIYDCFDLEVFLNSALENFSAEAARHKDFDTFSAVLFLTESRRDKKFEYLLDSIGGNNPNKEKFGPEWTFHRTGEKYSLCARRYDGRVLFLIAGRQIVAAENLEVLALATEKFIEDGMSLNETVQAVKALGAVPVVPWGTGKWLGYRGKILRHFIEKSNEDSLFLGDNGGRPVFWSRPSLFQLAEKKGIRILPGSDPLPFDHECRKPGSFGFAIPDYITHEYPARDIIGKLLDSKTRISAYGRLEKPFRFFRNQLKMQIRKRIQN